MCCVTLGWGGGWGVEDGGVGGVLHVNIAASWKSKWLGLSAKLKLDIFLLLKQETSPLSRLLRPRVALSLPSASAAHVNVCAASTPVPDYSAISIHVTPRLLMKQFRPLVPRDSECVTRRIWWDRPHRHHTATPPPPLPPTKKKKKEKKNSISPQSVMGICKVARFSVNERYNR